MGIVEGKGVVVLKINLYRRGTEGDRGREREGEGEGEREKIEEL